MTHYVQIIYIFSEFSENIYGFRTILFVVPNEMRQSLKMRKVLTVKNYIRKYVPSHLDVEACLHYVKEPDN